MRKRMSFRKEEEERGCLFNDKGECIYDPKKKPVVKKAVVKKEEVEVKKKEVVKKKETVLQKITKKIKAKKKGRF